MPGCCCWSLFRGSDLQGMPCLEAAGLRPSVVSRELGEDDRDYAKGKCFPTMQKKRQQVFPHSKIHVIPAVWKGLRTKRYTQSHPLHQWDPSAVSSATNSMTLPPSFPAHHCFPSPNPCTFPSFLFSRSWKPLHD